MSIKVYVVTLETKHGVDTVVYETREAAEASLIEYVAENWEDAVRAAEWADEDFPQESPGGWESVPLYFNTVDGEYSEINELPVLPA